MFKNLVIKNYKIKNYKIKNYKILHNLIQTPHMKLAGSLHIIRFALYEDS